MAVERSRRRDLGTSTRVIAGAWCILEAGRIVRAAAPGGRDFWAAGRGSWSRPGLRAESRAWPVHYAGAGSRLRLLEGAS